VRCAAAGAFYRCGERGLAPARDRAAGVGRVWREGLSATAGRSSSEPTVREVDGLALASRNRYLTPEERQRAPALYRALVAAAESVVAGAGTDTVAAQGRVALTAAGFRPEYFELRHGGDLGPPRRGERTAGNSGCRVAWQGAFDR